MPRYVILYHQLPEDSSRQSHFDLMIEEESAGVLKTWALAEAPFDGCRLAAEELPDHRLAYLDYEGPVSENRGTVTQWDAGEVKYEEGSEAHYRITGRRLRGELILARNQLSWQVAYKANGD